MLLVLLFITCRVAEPGDLCLAMPPVHHQSLCKASIEGMGELVVVNHLNLHVHSLSRNFRTEMANEFQVLRAG